MVFRAASPSAVRMREIRASSSASVGSGRECGQESGYCRIFGTIFYSVELEGGPARMEDRDERVSDLQVFAAKARVLQAFCANLLVED